MCYPDDVDKGSYHKAGFSVVDAFFTFMIRIIFSI